MVGPQGEWESGTAPVAERESHRYPFGSGIGSVLVAAPDSESVSSTEPFRLPNGCRCRPRSVTVSVPATPDPIELHPAAQARHPAQQASRSCSTTGSTSSGLVNGQTVLLGDVAFVHDGYAVQSNIVRVNGRRATYLAILRKSGASTLVSRERITESEPWDQPHGSVELTRSSSLEAERAKRASARSRAGNGVGPPRRCRGGGGGAPV